MALWTFEDNVMLDRMLTLAPSYVGLERFEVEAQKAEQRARIIRDVLLAGIMDEEKKIASKAWSLKQQMTNRLKMPRNARKAQCLIQ